MNDLRTAALMALRALELRRNNGNPAYDEQADEAITALRAVLVDNMTRGLTRATPTAKPLTDEQINAIEQWLAFGEQTAGSAHQGYFSGHGWAARTLRELIGG